MVRNTSLRSSPELHKSTRRPIGQHGETCGCIQHRSRPIAQRSKDLNDLGGLSSHLVLHPTPRFLHLRIAHRRPHDVRSKIYIRKDEIYDQQTYLKLSQGPTQVHRSQSGKTVRQGKRGKAETDEPSHPRVEPLCFAYETMVRHQVFLRVACGFCIIELGGSSGQVVRVSVAFPP